MDFIFIVFSYIETFHMTSPRPDMVKTRLLILQEQLARPLTEAEGDLELTTMRSGRGFTYAKHGLVSANVAVKQE